jgi:hypothetical protein
MRPSPTAYECKISISDFRADVTVAKWHKNLDNAYRVIFAAPAGLIKAADVPEACGLILRHDSAWRYAKKPVVNPRPIAQQALLKLLIDGVANEGPKARVRRWNDWDATAAFARNFGAEAARYVGDAASIHRDLARAEDQRLKMLEQARNDAKAIVQRATQEAPVMWAQLLETLGLDADAGRWEVQRVVNELKTAKEGTEEARELRRTVNVLRRLLESLSSFETQKPASLRPTGD